MWFAWLECLRFSYHVITFPRYHVPHPLIFPFLTFALLSAPLASASAAPTLFFSDLNSGPKTGNTDTSFGQTAGENGAIVTIWGKNLGSSQGNSSVVANGATASAIHYWGNADFTANLYKSHGMQKISFQISHLAQDGPGEIYVVVNGVQSNALPFIVRAGNIYFVKTTGNDSAGDGSWSNPWRTIIKAKNSIAAGDIAYIGDGIDQTTEDSYGAAVNLGSHGTADHPKALVAYPGAAVNIGSDSLGRAFHNWVTGGVGGYDGKHWVLAQFRIRSGSQGMPMTTGYRIVGNYFTGPLADGQTGIIEGGGNQAKILGNEFYDVGTPDGTKLYHVLYISGVRRSAGPRAETESDRELGWNYIHDCRCNRAINIYSEQDYSAFIENHRVHDNYIVNQRGDGILIGYYVTGENWVYNNVVINAGLGPDWGDGISSHTGIRVTAGHAEKTNTVIHIYNNTLYGNGDANSYPNSYGQLEMDPDAINRTTINFSNNIIYSLDAGDVYQTGWSGVLPARNYGNIWYGRGNGPSWDTAAVNTDPLFVDGANLDFHLESNSPAIDAGLNVSAIVMRDFDGVSRPQGAGIDIGAYEFCPGGDCVQPPPPPGGNPPPTPLPGTATLSGVRAYPNPWRSDRHQGKGVTFDNLTANSTVKLYTLSGHSIKTLDASAGWVGWNLDNDSGDKVASGIYLYVITNGQGQKIQGKLVVIK